MNEKNKLLLLLLCLFVCNGVKAQTLYIRTSVQSDSAKVPTQTDKRSVPLDPRVLLLLERSVDPDSSVGGTKELPKPTELDTITGTDGVLKQKTAKPGKDVSATNYGLPVLLARIKKSRVHC